MLVPNRHGSSTAYRYGFGGQEKDDELKGEGNSLNYTYRMHDPRVGRFFAVDPLSSKYPWYSPYQFAGNKVIQYGELEGLEETAFTMSLDKKFGSSAYLNMSTAQRNEERKVQATVAVLMVTTLVDIYVTKGWLTRSFIGGGLLEAMNETDRGNEARANGDEAEAQRRFKNAGEASKPAIVGILAEGMVFSVGKITSYTRLNLAKQWGAEVEYINLNSKVYTTTIKEGDELIQFRLKGTEGSKGSYYAKAGTKPEEIGLRTEDIGQTYKVVVDKDTKALISTHIKDKAPYYSPEAPPAEGGGTQIFSKDLKSNATFTPIPTP